MELDIGAEFFAGLGSKLNDLHGHFMRRKEYKCWDTPLIGSVPLTAGAGTLDGPLTPVRGQTWSIRRFTWYGWSAGTVSAYLDNQEPIFLNVSPSSTVYGMNTFGRGELLIPAGSRIVITATGITGVVQFYGRADTFMNDYLSEYLD